MKSKTLQRKKENIKETSESQADCSCQMLDTSLSAVGDSDCSCSECLQANLQAFNELKQMQEKLAKETEAKLTKGGSTRAVSNKQSRGLLHERTFDGQNVKTKFQNSKSIDRMRQTQPNKMHRQKVTFNSKVEYQGQPMESRYTRQGLNDFIKITQYRARQYLNQRSKLNKDQQKQRKRLKQLIKQNLQALTFNIQYKRNERQPPQGEQEFDPRFKWNHQPYHCKSRVKCRKLIPYDPELETKKQQIAQIEQRIRQYRKKNIKQQYQCPDRCPNHHLRTSKKTIAQRQKKIKQSAKEYQQQLKRQKAEKDEKQKIKAAKLRAIDIRCKNILAKSKKYDPTVSRTSFQNSIDHFSTFSQLRINKMEKQQEKQKKRNIKKAMKENGGMLQQKIYQNIEDSLIGDHPQIHSKLGAQSKYVEKYQEEDEDWCQKIVKDAKIKPPKDIKKEDQYKNKKGEKGRQKESKQEVKKNKKQSQKMIKKEEQRRKQLQMEIQRRKQQIFNQYQKRNSGVRDQKDQIKNKKMRMEYQESLKNKKSPQHHKSGTYKEESYDPYRQTYKHQPSKDSKQLKAVGDPLMHEYDYQKNIGKLKVMEVEQDHEIFTKSGTNLKSKQYLKV